MKGKGTDAGLGGGVGGTAGPGLGALGGNTEWKAGPEVVEDPWTQGPFIKGLLFWGSWL